jgi:HEAT repeat protein
MKTARFTSLLTALLCLCTLAAPAALAQQAARPMAEPAADQATWQRTVGAQLAMLLDEQDTPAMKDHVMKVVIRLNETSAVPLNFDPVVPKLFEIYRDDAEEDRRLAALQALGATNSPLAMKALAGHVEGERSSRVRQQTFAVLANYLRQQDAS